jgi:GTP cyclohydrolase III
MSTQTSATPLDAYRAASDALDAAYDAYESARSAVAATGNGPLAALLDGEGRVALLRVGYATRHFADTLAAATDAAYRAGLGES